MKITYIKLPLLEKGYPTLFWIASLDSHISRNKPISLTASNMHKKGYTMLKHQLTKYIVSLLVQSNQLVRVAPRPNQPVRILQDNDTYSLLLEKFTVLYYLEKNILNDIGMQNG